MMRKLAVLKRRWKAEEGDTDFEPVFADRPPHQFIVCKRSARIFDSTVPRPRASSWELQPLVSNGFGEELPVVAISNGRLQRAESSEMSDGFVDGPQPFVPSIQRPHENGYAMEDDYEEDGDAAEQPEGHLGLDMIFDLMDQTAESNLFDEMDAVPPSPSPPIEETPPVQQETSTYNLRKKNKKYERRDRSPSPDIELFESKAPKRPPPRRSFRDYLRCEPDGKAPVEGSDKFAMERFDFTMAVSVPKKFDFIPRIRGLLDVTEKFNANLPALPSQLKHLRAHTHEIRMTDVFAFARKKTANPEPDDPEREIVRLSAMPPRSFPDRPYVDVRSHLKAFTRPWPGIVVDPQFVRKQRLEEKERQDRRRAGLMLPPPLPGQDVDNDLDYTPGYDRKNRRKRRRRSQAKKRKSRDSLPDDQASLPDAASTIFDPDDLREPERSVMVVRSGTVRHTITRERFLEVDKIKNAFVTILFNKRLGVKSFEKVLNVLKDYVRTTVESKEQRPQKLQELLKNPTNALKNCIEDERLEPTVRVVNQKKLERITAELQKCRVTPLRANSKAKTLLNDVDAQAAQAAKKIRLHGKHSLTSLLFFGKAIISGPTMHDLNSTTAMPLMLSLCCEHGYVCVDTNEGDENTAGRADHMLLFNDDDDSLKEHPKAVQIAD